MNRHSTVRRLLAIICLLALLLTAGGAYAAEASGVVSAAAGGMGGGMAQVGLSPGNTGSVSVNDQNVKTAKMIFSIQGVNGLPTKVIVGNETSAATLTLTIDEDYAFDQKQRLNLVFWIDDGDNSRESKLMEFVRANGYGKYCINLTYSATEVIATHFYIYSQEDIIFSTQPENAYVDEGENAAFTVAVTGTTDGTYTYQWQRRGRDGWKTVSKATTTTLTISGVEAAQTGYQYRCLVSSSAGTAYSDTVRLVVKNVPETGDAAKPELYMLCALLALAGGTACVWGAMRPRRRPHNAGNATASQLPYDV